LSEQNLIQIKRFLIVLVLFLLCFALALGILLKHKEQALQKQNFQQTQAKTQLPKPFVTEEQNKTIVNPFQTITLLDVNSSQLDTRLNTNKTPSFQNFNNDKEFSSFIEQNLSQNALSLQDFLLQKEGIPFEQNMSFKTFKINPINTQNIFTNQNTKNKAKLAIIIDDMSNHAQVKELKALNLKLTPSFFPADTINKNTPQLAHEFDFYMVHLPLAAQNYTSKLDTLKPEDSQERIDTKIAQIKKDFANLKFINNHTGSLFTSDEKAMTKLFNALKSQNFIFVDSKTTHDSKAFKIASKTGQPYIQRDIFLDNEDELSYIKKQIQKAIILAQKKGFAIAIAHPKKNTFKALKQSKKLLENVELVYLSEIYGS